MEYFFKKNIIIQEIFSLRKNENSPYYNKEQNFYICSFGGCGSWTLVNYLAHFGNAYHVHSRNPPTNLTYVGNTNQTQNTTYDEWFNTIEIPEEDIDRYKVIYLYRNPIHAIYSRFQDANHLKHIETCETTELNDVIREKKDLYEIQEFFMNYTTQHKKRNYPIYGVKYETFFENIQSLNYILGIPDIVNLYPTRKQNNNRVYNEYEDLYPIYKNLIDKMDAYGFIHVG